MTSHKKKGTLPWNLASPKSGKTRRGLTRFILTVALVIGALLAGSLAASASTTAEPQSVSAVVPAYNAGQIPEYYQFCYDRTPTQHLQSTKSTTPKYWYKTAIAKSGGVDCQYMYAVFNIWPKTQTVTYSWTAVCKGMHKGTKGNWDAKKKLPYCTN